MFNEDDYKNTHGQDRQFESDPVDESIPSYAGGRSEKDFQRDMEYLLLQRQLKHVTADIEEKFVAVRLKFKSYLTIAVIIMVAIAFVMSITIFLAIDYSKNYEELKRQLIEELEDIHEYSYNIYGDAYETTIAAKVYDEQVGATVIIECPPSFNNGSCGTGIIVDITSEGTYILTNYHVISYAEFSNSTRRTVYYKINVRKNSSSYPVEASLVGYDADLDLALIRISAVSTPAGMKTAVFAYAASIKLGDYSVVIGNAAGYGLSVTSGLFSNKLSNLPYMSGVLFIQTSAAVNPGNSGGPLFNAKGYCVGVITLKKSYETDDEDSLVFEGMGFAIATEEAEKFINSLGFSGVNMHFAAV